MQLAFSLLMHCVAKDLNGQWGQIEELLLKWEMASLETQGKRAVMEKWFQLINSLSLLIARMSVGAGVILLGSLRAIAQVEIADLDRSPTPDLFGEYRVSRVQQDGQDQPVSESKFWVAKQSVNSGQRLQLAMLRPERIAAPVGASLIPGESQVGIRLSSLVGGSGGCRTRVALQRGSLPQSIFRSPLCRMQARAPSHREGQDWEWVFQQRAASPSRASAESRALLLGLTAFTFIPSDARIDSVTLQLRLPNTNGEAFPTRLWVTERTRGHILAAPLLFFGLPFPLQRSHFSHERVLELELEREVYPQ